MKNSRLITLLLTAIVASTTFSKECVLDENSFVTNTPKNITRILLTLPANTFQFGYTYKEFEFALRIYLLQSPEIRKKIYEEVLAAALKKGPSTVGGEALFSLILRDSQARELWDKRRPDSKTAERYKELAEQLGKLPTPTLHIGEIEKLVAGKPKNGTAFLSQLPKAYRTNYAVMFESGAAQESSEEDPRGIFFGEDIVVAFNGNPSHQRYENVEVMHLNPHTARTELRETIRNEGTGSVKLSQPNPKLCAECHGPTSDPYSKWMSYNFWQGAVAGHEDVLRGNTTKEGKSLGKLMGKAQSHERYKLMEDLKTHFTPEKDLAHANNGQLNRVLNLHSMVRMLRLMAATPNFCKFRYAVLGAVAGCKDIVSFIPEGVRKDFSDYGGIAENTKQLGVKLKEEFKKAYPQPSEQSDPLVFFEESSIANLRYLFEGRGIRMKGWSTDPFTGYGWNDGTYTLSDFSILLRYAYDDLFGEYPPHQIGLDGPNDCDWYKKQSLSALASLAPQQSDPESESNLTPHR